METKLEQMRQLERIAANTWPAETERRFGAWIARASRGVTKRANSVLTAGERPGDPKWLEDIERFYRERSLPVYFHISDASPPGLDEELAEQGYVKETPCLVMTAESEEVFELAARKLAHRDMDRYEARYTECPDERWLEEFIKIEQFPAERRDFYTGLFQRMGAGKIFVSLADGQRTVAVGTALTEGLWAGFVNVAVREQDRGKGIGYFLMQKLAEWSVNQGAERLYLQVIADNMPALRLYRNIGFAPFFAYHYRKKE
jgi:GNAT superfamily N-acetyltransferase